MNAAASWNGSGCDDDVQHPVVCVRKNKVCPYAMIFSMIVPARVSLVPMKDSRVCCCAHRLATGMWEMK